MLDKIKRYYHTIKYLKIIQIRYQIWYRVKNKLFPDRYNLGKVRELSFTKLKIADFPNQHHHITSESVFSFLNITKEFKKGIDWNFSDYGKLWTYHLNYFDFLHQDEMNRETGYSLIKDFIDQTDQIKDGYEPYPVSLRTINWIKFCSKHQRFEQGVIEHLYAHYNLLLKKLEYHLLANHLLENAFSLMVGAMLFPEHKALSKKATELLRIQLNEQILKDGSHYELSPMYHCIILQRALDTYNLLISNKHDFQSTEIVLKKKIQLMVAWLNSIVFSNGEIPMVNDSTKGQAISVPKLFEYAESLGFEKNKVSLTACGYRKFNWNKFELFTDVGNIKPSYQPGHAHADALSFVLYHDHKPLIVDQGISTYEKNERRDRERGTSAHNTVTINSLNQSDVWGGFRVGNRAETRIIEESGKILCAEHDGYKDRQVIHKRIWEIQKSRLTIRDEVSCGYQIAEARIHLHPDVQIKENRDKIILNDEIEIRINSKIEALIINSYDYCEGFNKTRSGYCLKLRFKDLLDIHIS